MVPPVTRYLIQHAIQKLKTQREFGDLNSTQWHRAETITFDAIKKQHEDEPYLSNNHSMSSPAYTKMIEEVLASSLTQVRHRLF